MDLSSLRTKCTLFDSFAIQSGRKEIGGKLQVRIKLREPLLAKQGNNLVVQLHRLMIFNLICSLYSFFKTLVEEIKEKWLVFN